MGWGAASRVPVTERGCSLVYLVSDWFCAEMSAGCTAWETFLSAPCLLAVPIVTAGLHERPFHSQVTVMNDSAIDDLRPHYAFVLRLGLVVLCMLAGLTNLRGQESRSAASRSLDYPVAEVIAEPEAIAVAGSLVDFESQALANHPALARAWAEVRQAEGEAWQARLMPNPQLGFGVPQFAGSESQYNVTVGQEIPTGGKLRLSSAVLWQDVVRARQAVERTRFEVLTQVRQQYFSALAARNRTAILEQLVSISRRSRELGEAQLRAGEATRTDTLLLEVELNKAEVALETTRTIYETRLRQLAAAVGLPDLPIAEVNGSLDAPLPDIELVETQEEALAANARLRMAEAGIQRSELQLRRALVEPSPTFQVMGGYQYQATPIRDQATMEILMTVPLWNRNQGGIRAARAGISQAIAQRHQVAAEIAGEVADAMRRYKAAEQLVERYREAILPRSQESFELTQRLYEQGEIDFLRLLQTQRSLIEVNLDYIDAQENRWLAAAEIAGLLQLEQLLP